MSANLQRSYDSSKEEVQQQSYRQLRSAQEVFESVLANELPVIATILEAAFDEALAELARRPPTFQNRNSKANRINELIKGMLFERFPDEMNEDSDRFYFIKDGYKIYFKKLDDALKPMNVSTRRSRRILNQLQMPYNNGDVLVEIFVGYLPSRSWDDIKKLCAVYISQNTVVWVTDLRRISATGPLQINLFPVVPADDTPLSVQPKEKRRDNQASSSS